MERDEVRQSIEERERKKQEIMENLRRRMQSKMEEKSRQNFDSSQENEENPRYQSKMEEESTKEEEKEEDSTMEEDEKSCRVCRSGEEENRPLFYPCRCRGSIKYVHQDCLLTWISHSKVESCELCKTKYTFTPVYAPGTPYKLPITDFVIGGLSKLAKWGKLLMRFISVLFAWSVFFPITTSWIFKFYFGLMADLENSSEWLKEFTIQNLLYSWGTGLILTAFVLGVSLALGSLLEYIQAHLLEHQYFANRERQQNEENNLDEIEVDPMAPLPLHIQQQIQWDRVAQAAGIQPEGAADQEGGMIGIFNFIVRVINAPVLPIEMDEELGELVGMNGGLNVLFWKLVFVIKCFAGFLALIIFVPKTIGSVALILVHKGLEAFSSHLSPTSLTQFKSVASTSFTGSDFNSGLICLMIGYLCLSLSSGIWALLAFLYSKRGNNQRSPLEQLVSLLSTFSKVTIILSMEVGLFPIYAGYVADYCSYELFHKSGDFFTNSRTWFWKSPIFSLLIHFVIGILYMLSFASIVSWMREILREKTMWFFRNPTDPDFDPLKEIIEQPTIRHIRRIFLSIFIYGFVLVLLVWVPTQIFKKFLPGFGMVSTGFEDTIEEVPLDFGFCQIIIPVLLNRRTRPTVFLKKCLDVWFHKVGELLQLSSFLFPPPEGTPKEEDIIVYPNHFKLRITALFLAGFATLSLSSLCIMFFPTIVGRLILSFFPSIYLNDVYKFLIGFAVIWGTGSFTHSLLSREGDRALTSIAIKYVTVGLKWVLFVMCMFVIAPIILGGIFEATFIIPLLTDARESSLPIYYVNWSIGATMMKIAFEVVMFEGYNNKFKRSIEKLKSDGLLGLNLYESLKNLFMPLLWWPLYFYSVPYVAVYLICEIFSMDVQTELDLLRYTHLLLLSCFIGLLVIIYVASLLPYFYQAIYDDRYLIGMKLHNMDTEQKKSPPPLTQPDEELEDLIAQTHQDIAQEAEVAE